MKKIRILIVDDQELMLDGLKIILEAENDIEIAGAVQDGQNALQAVEELKPDIVLLDIRMPGMNGVQCTKAIKEKYSDVIVIILTTFDDEEYIIDALRYGAAGYLLKDIKRELLVRSIRDAYHGEMLMPSKVAAKLAGVLSKDYEKESRLKDDFRLSEGEKEVAIMLSQGFTNKQIASALNFSEGTVKNYVSSIYTKVGISDRTSVALFLKTYLSQ